MRLLLAVVLSFYVFVGNTPKASAAVGLIIKHKTARVVGGVMTVGGVATFFGSMLASSFVSATISIAVMVVSVPVAAVGLVVLDEKDADLSFSELSEEDASKIEATAFELNVYNTEVDQLNAVKVEIESRVTDETSTEEINCLWQEYKDKLSPETLKVAGLVAQKVLNIKTI
jgi:hypothetical protein